MRAYVLAFSMALFFDSRLYGQLSDFSKTDFQEADSIAELYPRHPLENLKVLSDKLTRPLSTDVEKFRAIFKWVCLNVESDYALFVENKNMRRTLRGEKLTTWEKRFSARSKRWAENSEKQNRTFSAGLNPPVHCSSP